jgi:hypothetical protein
MKKITTLVLKLVNVYDHNKANSLKIIFKERFRYLNRFLLCIQDIKHFLICVEIDYILRDIFRANV